MSIQTPFMSAKASMCASVARSSVSNRPIWLVEAACSFDGLAADDPPHDRVEAEPVGIVHVVVPAKASENGLAKLPGKTVASILPTTGFR